jgi:hypothetical protein
MSYPSPDRWSDQLWRAVLTLLATAIGAFVAWKLLAQLFPGLLVAAVLLLVLRLAVGGIRGRREW